MPKNRNRKVECQVCGNNIRMDTEHRHYTKGHRLTEEQTQE